MLKRACVTITLCLFSVSFNACGQSLAAFQKDADIVRLNHIEYYGNLLDEYYTKTQTYPLMGKADVPVYSFVASPEQLDDVRGGPPYEHLVVDFPAFINELERVLGRDIKEYYDPQYEPDSKPNFYIYMVDKDIFNFAIHTSQAYPFSNPVGPGYNKVEITNNTNGSRHLITSQDLFSMDAFREAKAQKIAKPDFFKAREVKFLTATKRKK